MWSIGESLWSDISRRVVERASQAPKKLILHHAPSIVADSGDPELRWGHPDTEEGAVTTRLPRKARTVTTKAGNRSGTQAATRSRTKGDARRESILDAAASLLEGALLEDLTYRAVCGRARVPESSAYHFFPDLPAIYRALLTRLGKRHDEYCFRDLAPAERKTWKAVVETTMARSAAFQRRNPVFAKLTISGKVPFDLKQFDRTADRG